VHEIILHSGWDSMMLGIPFIGMLFIGFFRLDEVFTSKGQTKTLDRQRRSFSLVDENGEPVVCDPDGRPS
jgi:hypothetical protein